MKKINRYLLSFIALGAVLTSCQKDQELSGTIENSANSVTITAEAQNETGTRSSLNVLAFSWEAGDQLSVYNSTNANAQFTLDGAIGKKAAFKGDLSPTSGAEVLYAVYPYNGSNAFATGGNDNITYTFTLDGPQVQKTLVDGTPDTKSIGAYAYMYGKTAAPISLNGTDVNVGMKMSHLMTFLDFKISNAAGEKVTSLVLTSTTDIATSKIVNINEGSVSPNGTDVTTLTVNLQDSEGNPGVTAPATGPLIVRLAMLPQTFIQGTVWTIEL